MPSLHIPESGMAFAGPSKPDSTTPTALGLTLTDGVIEEMIKCVQKGKPIQLSLGDHPKLHYGTKTQPLSTTEGFLTHELYRSTSLLSETDSSDNLEMNRPAVANPKMGVIKVQHKIHPGFAALCGVRHLTMKKGATTQVGKSTSKQSPITTSTTTAKTPSLTAGADAALEALQASMASEHARKAGNTTKFMKDIPIQDHRKAKLGNRTKYLSGGASTNTSRSMPSSPNLSGVGSPALGPTSAPLSQQQFEQAKATRKPVVHLLATRPMAESELKIKIPDASNNDIKQALLKVGDFNENSSKWELRKNFYKELDVFTFKYHSEEDRQRAIDNAVKQYDRLRLGISEPEWDRLLPKEERGTGKCLSKLQASIAQGTAGKAPKINVQKPYDSGRDTASGGDNEEDDLFGDKNLKKLKSDGVTRSVSQPPTTKSKKVSEKEAQGKRLQSNNPSKPKPKPAPMKKEKPAQKGATRVLSSQFVSDSDEEDSYMIPQPSSKPNAGAKRAREEDPETSDSSIPLSKKVKKDVSNHRISDASQSSLTTNTTTYSSSSSKTKVNSPQKSSPLASSPPTNASEFENSSGHTSSASPAHHASTKVSRSPIHKRHQKSSSVTSSASSTTSTRSLKPEVMDLARRYRTFYPKYEALHKEVASMGKGGRRDTEKEHMLLDMHQRLSLMKKDILAGIVESN